jgi:hypothetical protein
MLKAAQRSRNRCRNPRPRKKRSGRLKTVCRPEKDQKRKNVIPSMGPPIQGRGGCLATHENLPSVKMALAEG